MSPSIGDSAAVLPSRAMHARTVAPGPALPRMGARSAGTARSAAGTRLCQCVGSSTATSRTPSGASFVRPRIEADGRSFRDELITVKGTRRQLMVHLKKRFADWSPHDWIDRWATHDRHLTYATFSPTEMCISTDFSAQYEHK
jgi:hypothetical protein